MLNAADAVEIARSFKPTIRAHQDGMDAARRLPDALAQALAEAGFYRLCAPRSIGGAELHPRIMAQTLEALAEADASAAWCVMIGATSSALGAYMERAAAEEIYGDPTAIVCGVYAPSGKAVRDGDAYEISGRWKWNSGGQNAKWLGGGCLLFEDGAMKTFENGAPMHRMVFFPASEASFIDTWKTGGLKGTGSGDMAVKSARAPITHSASLITDRAREPGALYKFPAFGLLSLGIASVAAGNGHAALAEFAAFAREKRPAPNARTMAERQTIQAMYADADARMNAARALLYESVEAAWRDAQDLDEISIDRRARLRLAATHVTRTAAEVTRTLQDYAGGAAVFTDDPLQRRARDAQTMTAHIMIAPATYELTGRALFGLPMNAQEL